MRAKTPTKSNHHWQLLNKLRYILFVLAVNTAKSCSNSESVNKAAILFPKKPKQPV